VRRSARVSLRRLSAISLGLALVVGACTQPGASPAASPADSGMMEHSPSPADSGMMEHSPSPSAP
jgi:hypothetical protein